MAFRVRGYHVYTLYSNGKYAPPNSAICRSSRLADAIVADGMVMENDSFRSGRPSMGFKYQRIGMCPAIAFHDPETDENCMHCICARTLF